MKHSKMFMVVFSLALLAVFVTSPGLAATRHIYLAATDGYVYMPDGFQSGAANPGVPFGGPGNWQGTPDASYLAVAGTPPASGPNVGTPNWGTATPGFGAAMNLPNGTPGAEDVRGYIRGFVGCRQPQGGPTAWNPAVDCPPPGTAVLPAPIIDVNQMDHVFLHLVNLGNRNPMIAPDAHNIHLHGIHTTTQNDGFNEFSFEAPVPTTPYVFDTSGNLVSVGAGFVPVTYYFLAEHAGTYMYHCHVEASEHVQMGLYGAMIIRPPGYAAAVANRRPFVYDGLHNDFFDVNTATGAPQEFILLFSEYDSKEHGMVGMGIPFHHPEFRPDYFLLNGRSFPDTIRPVNSTYFTDGIADVGPSLVWSGPPRGWVAGSNNFATYNGLIAVDLGNKGRPEGFGKKFLLRMIGLGFTHTPMHIHGWHFKMVGKDASPVPRTAQLDGEFTLNLASGSTYDLIISADCKAGVGQYSTQSISSRGVFDAADKTFLSLGGFPPQDGWLPDGTPSPSPNPYVIGDNVLSVQLYPLHSHHDQTVTNDGIYPGGAVAVILAANPAGGTCQ